MAGKRRYKARRDSKGRFLAGASGNPSGRPLERVDLRKMLNDAMGDTITLKDGSEVIIASLYIERLLQLAIEGGNTALMISIFEQMAGKAMARHEVSGLEGGEININITRNTPAPVDPPAEDDNEEVIP